ncbi:hypothetical protein BpHYR1_017396 [Brachionus plicatilis]|uniref:Uncharacterized protein n=1 Tax=Brachionus plicatilis TaxID=10195 RepID=A0A3M7PR00_BRAPC|nr:hypothetical protein BpHYR1_017396 [Brachionus plicatilis]
MKYKGERLNYLNLNTLELESLGTKLTYLKNILWFIVYYCLLFIVGSDLLLINIVDFRISLISGVKTKGLSKSKVKNLQNLKDKFKSKTKSILQIAKYSISTFKLFYEFIRKRFPTASLAYVLICLLVYLMLLILEAKI